MLRRTALACTCGVALALVGFPGGAWADFTVTEGQSFSGKVVDVGTCNLTSATINWGDGTPTSAGVSDNATGVKGTHTYADEGTYNGTVSYTCSQFDGTATASFQATVQDAPLTGVGRNVSGTAGQSLTTMVAHIIDANPGAGASDFAAQITWGDGTSSPGSVAAAAGGGFDVTGTHTYNAAGNYPVNTSIADVGGSSHNDQLHGPDRGCGCPATAEHRCAGRVRRGARDGHAHDHERLLERLAGQLPVPVAALRDTNRRSVLRSGGRQREQLHPRAR